MKSSIPLPVVFFAAAMIGAAGYFFYKQRAPRQNPPQLAQQGSPSKAQAKIFEDAAVSFQYPHNYVVRTGAVEKPKYRYWMAEYPEQIDYSLWGEITLSEYLERKESRSLEDVYKSQNRSAKQVHPPKTVLLDGGKCLSYRLDYALDDNRVDLDGRTRTVQSCTRVENRAHCYADDGRYFELHAFSGGFCDRQNPDAVTLGKLKSYEAFIRSLRIKPVS